MNNKIIKDVKLNIAIDGPSGVGKSTVARILADQWGLFFLNTGLIYRAIALNVLENNLDPSNEEAVVALLKPNIFELKENEQVFLNNQNVTSKIRNDKVSQTASLISSYEKVREYAFLVQSQIIKNKNVIAEGRDTTFKILPHAEVKIYLDTLNTIRAQRRFEQNKKLGFNADYDFILKEIDERDKRDKSRKMDPLQIVPDAVYIDASNLTTEEVVEKINVIIKEKLNLK